LFIEILTPFIFATIRVMRGGLGPQPPRWLMWLMPPIAVFALTQNYYLTGASILLAWQFNMGYSDYDNDNITGWEDAFWDMAIRCAPSAAFVGSVAVYNSLGLSDVNLYSVVGALAIVVASNMMQPLTRKWFDGKWPWPNHSNRLGGEIPEGFALGLLVVSVAV